MSRQILKMKKIYKLVGVFALLFSVSSVAQQTPEYTFWRQNMIWKLFKLNFIENNWRH